MESSQNYSRNQQEWERKSIVILEVDERSLSIEADMRIGMSKVVVVAIEMLVDLLAGPFAHSRPVIDQLVTWLRSLDVLSCARRVKSDVIIHGFLMRPSRTTPHSPSAEAGCYRKRKTKIKNSANVDVLGLRRAKKAQAVIKSIN